jgi:hypothetical protein
VRLHSGQGPSVTLGTDDRARCASQAQCIYVPYPVILRNGQDRTDWLAVLGEVCSRCNRRCHADGEMNHPKSP